MIKKLNKILFFATLSLTQMGWFQANAQQIKAQVKATGNQYQIIQIPQEFRSIIGNEVSKIRIKDAKGKEIPYITQYDAEAQQDFYSVPFEITQTDSTDIFLIPNTLKRKWNNLTLKIANSTVVKNYSIEGSKDGKEWFSLVNNEILSDLQDDQETYVYKNISFPLNDYNFIRFIIQNKKSAPINILEIGDIKTSNIEQPFVKLKSISFTKEENQKEKTTLLKIHKDGYIPFDAIQFHIASPKLYSRDAYIYEEKEIIIKKKNKTTIKNSYYFDLKNDNATRIQTPAYDYPKEFLIKIENNDNQPLQIHSISLFQIPINLIAQLDEGQLYSLEADTTWSMPNYDITNINLNLPKNLNEASVVQIQKITAKDEPENKSYGKLMLIIGSILGTLIVFYFGNSLIKDMKKEKED